MALNKLEFFLKYAAASRHESNTPPRQIATDVSAIVIAATSTVAGAMVPFEKGTTIG
jgi:hypothetical protein